MASNNSDPEPFLQLIEAKPELCGRFAQMKRLGIRGGGGNFSLLFNAYDKDRGEQVALKFFDPNENDPYRLQSFMREVEILSKLKNQQDILQNYSDMQQIVETFKHPLGMVLSVPLNFYALELAASDLGTIMEQFPVEPAQKLIWFRALCRAVQRVHRLGIVHRDIKPSNCLIMPDGSLKLSDFGTARCLIDGTGALKRYSGPPGDWTYAAPEMIATLHDIKPEIAYAADIYALGALLFESFTGTPLNVHLFSRTMLSNLNLLMQAVFPGDKLNEFHSAIESISNQHPLPDVRDFGDVTPRSIAPIINRTYRDLATLDYRRRPKNCSATFMQISQCLVVLNNEDAYSRWMQRKKAKREALARKFPKTGHTLAKDTNS